MRNILWQNSYYCGRDGLGQVSTGHCGCGMEGRTQMVTGKATCLASEPKSETRAASAGSQLTFAI